MPTCNGSYVTFALSASNGTKRVGRFSGGGSGESQSGISKRMPGGKRSTASRAFVPQKRGSGCYPGFASGIPALKSLAARFGRVPDDLPWQGMVADGFRNGSKKCFSIFWSANGWAFRALLGVSLGKRVFPFALARFELVASAGERHLLR